MPFRPLPHFCLATSLLLVLGGCAALSPLSEVEQLNQQIAIEKKKQELERLRNAGKPSPAPTSDPADAASTSPGSGPMNPGPTNQSPQINLLDSVLTTTTRHNDSVRLIVKASDADGDPLEYSWSSVYDGLSTTRGEAATWLPTADLAGKTNVITVTVTDKRGGSSTASLNIFIRDDGTLLVREDSAAKPVIGSLVATATTDGRILMRAVATDPNGGLLRYRWSASAGQFSTADTASAIWEPQGAVGEISLTLSVSSAQGISAQDSFVFSRSADGQLNGGFSGTPLQIGSGETLVPGTELQILGKFLVYDYEANELYNFDPQTRTRKNLFKLSNLPPAISTVYSQQFRNLLFDPASKQAYIVLEANVNYQAHTRVIAVATDSGEARETAMLAPKQTLLGELVTVGVRQPYLQGGKLMAVHQLSSTGNWLGEIGSLDFSHHLPSNLAIWSISPQGLVLGYHFVGNQPSSELTLYDSSKGEERVIADWTELGIDVNQVSDMHWNHAGDQVAFAIGHQLYVLDTQGKLRLKWTHDQTQTIQKLAWSPDDLHLSFAVSDQPSSGSVHVLDIAHPERRLDTRLDVSHAGYNNLLWIP